MRKGEKKKIEVILKRKCDTAMADKKGFFPCDGGTKCASCIACMEQIENGEWRHHDPMRGGNRHMPQATW